jgi:hypothetical protein
LVFTDDIDISNLKDNLGRPLTSIYLTFIKNNRGYKEWYGFDDTNVDIGADAVEYSHCFGKITCGLEMVDDNLADLNNEEKDDKEIREKLGDESGHCINTMIFNEGYEVSGLNQNRSSNISATEVSYYEDKHFYGDLCCYDNYNANEEVIQPFMFRFNTAQRESINALSGSSFLLLNMMKLLGMIMMSKLLMSWKNLLKVVITKTRVIITNHTMKYRLRHSAH